MCKQLFKPSWSDYEEARRVISDRSSTLAIALEPINEQVNDMLTIENATLSLDLIHGIEPHSVRMLTTGISKRNDNRFKLFFLASTHILTRPELHSIHNSKNLIDLLGCAHLSYDVIFPNHRVKEHFEYHSEWPLTGRLDWYFIEKAGPKFHGPNREAGRLSNETNPLNNDSNI